MDNARTAELVLDSAADPEYFVLRLHFRDTNVRGKEAYVTLSVETEVRDSRPVNESEELFREDFVIEGLDREIRIPRVRVPHYSYAGKRINMLIHTKLVIDDALIFDTTISEPQEIALGLRPPGPFDSPDLIDPHDAFDFLKNIKAVPAKNRYVIFAVGGAVLLGWGALVLVLLNLKSGVIQLGIFGTAVGLFLTALAYSYMRHLLAAYVNLKLKRLDEPIRRDTKLRASDLFEGFTFSAAKNCTLRIIAYNTEHGQYRRGSGTKVRTVSFSDPLRVLKLYEKKLDIIPRDHRVDQYFQDEIDFSGVFRCLYPPNMTSVTHGLAFEWEIQILHPEYQDIELPGDPRAFAYEDFFAVPPEPRDVV